MLPIIIYCRHSLGELHTGMIREFGTILELFAPKLDYMMMVELVDDMKMSLHNRWIV